MCVRPERSDSRPGGPSGPRLILRHRCGAVHTDVVPHDSLGHPGQPSGVVFPAERGEVREGLIGFQLRCQQVLHVGAVLAHRELEGRPNVGDLTSSPA